MFRLHCEGLAAQGCEPVHELVPDELEDHDWRPGKIERVAKVRQGFLDRWLRNPPADWISHDTVFEPDGLFMVDTDVICGPGVLERMMAVDADVVYGVFWTQWGGPRQPQVWDIHPYGFSDELTRVINRSQQFPDEVVEREVYGGGACTLIRRRGFESRYWPLMKGLPQDGSMWIGEDRTFCIGLEARGIKQVAVFGLPIEHLYTKDMQTPEALKRVREKVGL